jgi:hypothetical protein
VVRQATFLALVGLVPLTGALVGSGPAASEHAATVSSYYLGRGDPRLCPSPECGGVWVRHVNRSTTDCGEPLGRRRECYVAAVDASRVRVPRTLRPRLEGLVASGLAVARGRLVPGRVVGFPELATLVATEVWPASSAPGTTAGPFRLLRDNGVRCVTVPCFSTDAELLNSSRRKTISRLDLSRLRTTRAERDHAREEIAGKGLIVAGRIVADVSEGARGRVLVASQFYVRAP